MAAQFGSNSFPTEFNFIENPIIVHIMGPGYLSFPDDSTFRQVVIKVDVRPTWDGVARTYYFYADASSVGQEGLSVDVSTALRAAMKGWEPDVDSIGVKAESGFDYSCPYATFSVTISEKYMQEGEVKEITGATRGGAYAYYGGLSGYELWSFTKHATDLNPSFTRKPATGELHATGDLSIYTVFSGGMVRMHGTIISSGVFEKGEMQQFLFVNSLGVLETVSAFSKESLSYSIESETKNLSYGPSYFAKPNRTTHKTGGRGTFAMSSGYVNRDWADWWTTEFLMAKKYWMLYDNRWMPVTVTPSDEDTLIYNKAEQMLPHVDFNVEIAVEGSIRNRVRTS